MLICILHGACGRDRVTVVVFLLFTTRVFHTTRVFYMTIRVMHLFITRVVPRVTLRVIVSARLNRSKFRIRNADWSILRPCIPSI